MRRPIPYRERLGVGRVEGGGDAGQTRRGDGGWSKREPKEQLARHVGPNPASARPRPAHETPNSKTSVRRTRNSLAGKKWYSWFHLLVHSSSSEIRQAVAALLSPACARLSRRTSFESASFDDPHLDPTYRKSRHSCSVCKILDFLSLDSSISTVLVDPSPFGSVRLEREARSKGARDIDM